MLPPHSGPSLLRCPRAGLGRWRARSRSTGAAGFLLSWRRRPRPHVVVSCRGSPPIAVTPWCLRLPPATSSRIFAGCLRARPETVSSVGGLSSSGSIWKRTPRPGYLIRPSARNHIDAGRALRSSGFVCFGLTVRRNGLSSRWRSGPQLAAAIPARSPWITFKARCCRTALPRTRSLSPFLCAVPCLPGARRSDPTRSMFCGRYPRPGRWCLRAPGGLGRPRRRRSGSRSRCGTLGFPLIFPPMGFGRLGPRSVLRPVRVRTRFKLGSAIGR